MIVEAWACLLVAAFTTTLLVSAVAAIAVLFRVIKWGFGL